MRKNELLKLNYELYGDLERLKCDFEELKKENIKLKEKLNALQSNDNTEASLKETEADNIEKSKSESTETENSDFFTPLAEYSAAVIGKAVIEAARLCGKLSADKASNTAREQINLILGRCEVAKSEILEILSSDKGDELKRTLIDDEFTSTSNYFAGVMAQ